MKKTLFLIVFVIFFSGTLFQNADAQFNKFGFGLRWDNWFPTGNTYTPNLNIVTAKFNLMTKDKTFGFFGEGMFINDNTVKELDLNNGEGKMRASGAGGFTFELFKTQNFYSRLDIGGGIQTGDYLFEEKMSPFHANIKFAAEYRFTKSILLFIQSKTKFNKKLVLLDSEVEMFFGKPEAVQFGIGFKFFKYNKNPGTFGPIARVGKGFKNFTLDIMGGINWGITGEKVQTIYFGMGLYFSQ